MGSHDSKRIEAAKARLAAHAAENDTKPPAPILNSDASPSCEVAAYCDRHGLTLDWVYLGVEPDPVDPVLGAYQKHMSVLQVILDEGAKPCNGNYDTPIMRDLLIKKASLEADITQTIAPTLSGVSAQMSFVRDELATGMASNDALIAAIENAVQTVIRINEGKVL